MGGELKNKVIVVTRSQDQAAESIKKLESLGARVIPFPAIKIRPIKVFNHFDNYASELNKFDYLIFTSENAVKYSMERLAERKLKLPTDLKIVCVGKKSAEKCEELGIEVNVVPDDYSAKGLIEYFSKIDVEDKRFFIPSSAIARSELRYNLTKRNAEVHQIPIYDVGLPDDDEIKKSKKLVESSKLDLFIFTSPSTFRNTVKILGIKNPQKYFANYTTAAIGTTTAASMKDMSVTADIVPSEFTMDNLIDAIIDFYNKN